MSLNDQFEHGRIPLKPLPFSNKELSQCNEIMIDYGENGTYHIYITHHNDPNKYIDITSLIINEMLPKADINANQFTISIEGADKPVSLQDIINFIYKRFEYADDKSGFIFDRDKDKLFSSTTKTIILRTTDGTYQLPVTTADNVYDKNGKTIQDRLDQMTRLAFDTTYITATRQDQIRFKFDFPFTNYSDYMEVRIGTTYVDKSRYTIEKIYDAGSTTNYSSGRLTFLDESVEIGRSITILWIYNSYNIDDTTINNTSGSIIVNKSISIDKLNKVSNSFMLNDSSSLATSKALNDLYNHIIDNFTTDTNNTTNYFKENNVPEYKNYIGIYVPKFMEDSSSDEYMDYIVNNNSVMVISLSHDHPYYPDGYFLSIYDKNNTEYTIPILLPDENIPNPAAFKANSLIKLIIPNGPYISSAILINQSRGLIKPAKYVHTCIDQETIISYKKLTADEYVGVMNVYRNGVRLFEDLDYSINEDDNEITLFVRTEEGERIVFELVSTGGEA